MRKDNHRMREHTGNYVFKKWLVSGIYKDFLQHNFKKVTRLKNGQRIWTDISPKKMYKLIISTWKDVNILSY